MRLPSASAGRAPSSRAKSSEIERNAAAGFDVGPRQVASRDDPSAHGFEVARRDELHSALRRRLAGRQRLSFDHDVRGVDERRPFHRQRAREAGGCDARKRGNRVEDLVHAHELRRVADELVRNPRAHGLDGGRFREPRIDVAQCLKRSDHEHRAHDQHERERHLDDDQCVARRGALAARARAACAGERWTFRSART